MSLKKILKRWGIPQENIKPMSDEIEADYGTRRYLDGFAAGNHSAETIGEKYDNTLPPGTVLAVRRMPDGTTKVLCPNPAAALEAIAAHAASASKPGDAERFDEVRPAVACLLTQGSRRT